MTQPASFLEDGTPTPGATPEQIRLAETELGVRLPMAYVALLTQANGGTPRRGCFPTGFRTEWAGDHFDVGDLLGVGPDGPSVLDSGYMIGEWDLPVGQVLISSTPSGHDWVLLDYSSCGTQGEPAVVYVQEDGRGGYTTHKVAPDTTMFLAALTECSE